MAIGQWVVDEACGALAEHHRRQSPDERQLWMSVNVSPIEITRAGFAAGVYATPERHGIAPEALIIEITEGVAMTDTGNAIAVLNELRSAGVHFALDDFGTGFSSLRSLHQLPIDVIKIDRSFLVNTVTISRCSRESSRSGAASALTSSPKESKRPRILPA